MPKMFMCGDGYNFWEPEATTVAASLGMGGCEGEIVTGVFSLLSIIFFLLAL